MAEGQSALELPGLCVKPQKISLLRELPLIDPLLRKLSTFPA